MSILKRVPISRSIYVFNSVRVFYRGSEQKTIINALTPVSDLIRE